MRPIIGIAGDALTQPSAKIDLNQADYVPRAIKQAVLKVGGLPVILPFSDDLQLTEEIAEQLADTIDGLILPGGPDVAPIVYHEEPIPQLGAVIYAEDLFETALIKAILQNKKPIFAICRGIQILNVALGGNLYQDLAVQYPDLKIQHKQQSFGNYPIHHVKIDPDSQLAELLGKTAFVNSRHHQAIKMLAPVLKVVAKSADGVIEAVESRQNDLILGVQWHPENLWQDDPTQLRLFADLIRKAEKH